MTAPDQVLGATGLLGAFNTAGVLIAADVHTARLIGELWDEADESVLLAVALTVRALRGGSVCLDITRLADVVGDTLEEPSAELGWPSAEAWAAAIRRSPAITPTGAGAGARPLRLAGDLLYLERYWRTEQTVRHHLELRRRPIAPPGETPVLRRLLDALFDDPDLPRNEPHYQRLAATMTTLGQMTVVAGGPGTGKTTVVAKILALHEALRGSPPVTALAAPTGKAAARLEEAVLQTLGRLPQWSATTVPKAVTLHNLLGWRVGQATPRHTAANPLPHELVVVDEMSMVSLPHMAALLEAVRPDARLVLVGDPDQLASVEAGAVLADITRAAPAPSAAVLDTVARLAPEGRPPAVPDGAGVVRLRHTWRFGGRIARLARAIRAGDSSDAVAVLSEGHDDVRLIVTDGRGAPADLASVAAAVVATGRRMVEAAEAGDAPAALEALEEHRVLCAHRRGPCGVARWERRVQDWLRSAIEGYAASGDLYPGLPIMVTENDRDVGLYNGDTGVVVRTPRGLRAAFARGGAPTLFTSIDLNAIAHVHAMTVHKSQGSQFDRVTLVLPPVESPLLTRELIYTAITRARTGIEVIGTPEAVVRAVGRPANRASGLGAAGR